jgi:hypothetical protein
VTTDNAALTANTTVKMFGNVTDYGPYSTLTSGFFIGSTRYNDGSSSPTAPPYPAFVQAWSKVEAYCGTNCWIASSTITVNTTAGDSQMAAVNVCASQPGTGISINGGFTTVIDRTGDPNVAGCAGFGLRYYIALRHYGSHATSFTATFTPNNVVFASVFTVSEFGNLGSTGATYIKNQTSAHPNITETIPPQSVLFADFGTYGNALPLVWSPGHEAVSACDAASSSVCAHVGYNQNGDMTNASSVIVEPQYAGSSQFDITAVELIYISPPAAFTVTVSDLQACRRYSYRAFVAASGSSSPVAYGSTKTFLTLGECPVSLDIPGIFALAGFVVFVVGGSAALAVWLIGRKRKGGGGL